MIPETEFLTVEEVAEILRIAPRTVQGYCKTGKIGSSRSGRRYLIPRESLNTYLNIIK